MLSFDSFLFSQAFFATMEGVILDFSMLFPRECLPWYGLTTFINFWIGHSAPLLLTKVKGDSPVDVWGQHLYANKTLGNTWSHDALFSWHNFLKEAFRNMLKFSVFPFYLGV